MNTQKNAPRLLGAAFLLVAVVSLGSGLLLSSVVGSGSISDILVHVSQQGTLMRISSLGELATSAGIVALAGLLYSVLHTQHKLIALVALGCWLAEAISLDFVQAGAPVHSYYQTLGAFLYSGVNGLGMTFHMCFYCLGGMLWYALFSTSKYIPRVISLWGLLAVFVALVGIVLQLLGYEVSILVFLPILPFEVTIGGWLMLRGIKEHRRDVGAPAPSLSTIPSEGTV